MQPKCMRDVCSLYNDAVNCAIQQRHMGLGVRIHACGTTLRSSCSLCSVIPTLSAISACVGSLCKLADSSFSAFRDFIITSCRCTGSLHRTHAVRKDVCTSLPLEPTNVRSRRHTTHNTSDSWLLHGRQIMLSRSGWQLWLKEQAALGDQKICK